MALPTLEWTITDETILGVSDPEWTGLSNDASSMQCVNFLKYIAAHITAHSTHFEVVAQEYSTTDGTVVVGIKAAGGQRLSGINFILGTTTEADANMNGTLSGAGIKRGCEPHNESTNSHTDDMIWIAMSVGMSTPNQPDGGALAADDWKELDWTDNAVVAYSGGTPRFTGFASACSDMSDLGASAESYGVRIIESKEAFYLCIRETVGSGCFLAGAGALIIPQDASYAEEPGTGGWNDSDGVGSAGENNRLWAIMSNPVNPSGRNTQTNPDFWSRAVNLSQNIFHSVHTAENDLTYSVFSVLDPLAQDCSKYIVSRISQFTIAQQYGGDLTTAGGTRVHLDLPVRVGETPHYFLGRVRQVRAAQDSICGTILKDGAAAVKSIIWSNNAGSPSDSIGFDND